MEQISLSVVAYEKIARDFEKLNPGIKIEISTVSSKDRLKKVTAMGMARNLPTVFKLNPEERRFYSDKKWVSSLDLEIYFRFRFNHLSDDLI